MLENSRAVIHLDREDYAAARAGFVQLLDRPELAGISRAMVKNNLAWVDIMLGTHDALDEADAMSEAAYKAFTRMPYFMGTRGAVLIERGRIEDGIKLVRQSLGCHSEPRARAARYCYLAIAAGRLGRTEEAKKHLEHARSADAKSKLIPRVEQELAG